MKNNVVERVILLHDINSSRGTGMQNNDSRYLLSWEVVNRGIEEALNNSIEFEKIKFIKMKNLFALLLMTVVAPLWILQII